MKNSMNEQLHKRWNRLKERNNELVRAVFDELEKPIPDNNKIRELNDKLDQLSIEYHWLTKNIETLNQTMPLCLN
jgi:RNA processing factor Prp31